MSPDSSEGQADGCGVLATGCDLIGVAEGGGDVDIAVNYPTSGVPNLALVSLTLAPGVTATHSTNRGDTFTQPNLAAAAIPGDDRQWIEGFGGQNVYLVYHDVGTFNIEVQRSNDGGQTYVDGFGEAIDTPTLFAAGGVPPTNTAARTPRRFSFIGIGAGRWDCPDSTAPPHAPRWGPCP